MGRWSWLRTSRPPLNCKFPHVKNQKTYFWIPKNGTVCSCYASTSLISGLFQGEKVWSSLDWIGDFYLEPKGLRPWHYKVVSSSIQVCLVTSTRHAWSHWIMGSLLYIPWYVDGVTGTNYICCTRTLCQMANKIYWCRNGNRRMQPVSIQVSHSSRGTPGTWHRRDRDETTNEKSSPLSTKTTGLSSQQVAHMYSCDTCRPCA